MSKIINIVFSDEYNKIKKEIIQYLSSEIKSEQFHSAKDFESIIVNLELNASVSHGSFYLDLSEFVKESKTLSDFELNSLANSISNENYNLYAFRRSIKDLNLNYLFLEMTY